MYEASMFAQAISVPEKCINRVLKTTLIETPIGSMLAVADDQFLYYLGLVEGSRFERDVNRLQEFMKVALVADSTEPLCSIRKELEAYFEGSLRLFQTPLFLHGTLFQKMVWGSLQRIPYGTTVSYADLASSVGKPSAYRAAANANGANQFIIIIPCHRVVQSDGSLGGYSSGIRNKKWLLEHESRYV